MAAPSLRDRVVARAIPVVAQGALPVALAVLAVVETTTGYADHPAGPSGLLAVLLPMCAVLIARREAPLLTALAVSTLLAVEVLAVEPSIVSQPPATAFLVVLVMLFSLGLHGRGRCFLAASCYALGVILALQVAAFVQGQAVGDTVPSVAFMGTAFVLGRLLHRSRAAAQAERQRALVAEQDLADHAVRAAEEERARIARELHDVLAHALTGIVVQASVEARLHRDEDDGAVDTLAVIEEQGRAALVELRRLLGLLRADGQGSTSAPLPSLDSLDDLLEVFRVLQEALTNVARHAPGATVRVRLTGRPDAVLVEVSDSGTDAAPLGLSGGHGLAGMRERVRWLGGTLRTGAAPGGGFTVEAVIPREPALEVSA
jgi:signal transduction histidine kinase